MPLTSLLPPIAAATVLNVFLFALAWRGHQAERRSGRFPRLVFVPLVAYGGAIAIGLWLLGRSPALTSYPEIFVAAAGSQMFGAGVVFAILNALFFTRGQAAEHRVGAIVGAVLFVLMLIGAALY